MGQRGILNANKKIGAPFERYKLIILWKISQFYKNKLFLMKFLSF